MRKADIVSAAVVAAFGLALLFVVIPLWIPGHGSGEYGLHAEDLPTLMAAITASLAAVFLVARLVNRGGRAAAEETEDAPPPITRGNWLFLLRSTLFLVVVTALFEWVGFLAAGAITIGGFMIAMGERRPVHVVLTSVVVTGAIWLFFWQLLRFPLP